MGGVLAGEEVRISLETRDSKRANQIVHEMEAKEMLPDRGTPKTLDFAWTQFIADLEARKLNLGTIRKYKLLKYQMTTYGEQNGFALLREFDLNVLREFRATWKSISALTASKHLERLRCFFRFCFESQWCESNLAKLIKPPKVKPGQTLPLTRDEMTALLVACDALIQSVPLSAKLGMLRLKSLILLMRYTGLRISDAVGFTTDRLDGNKVFLYTKKTGEPVSTKLPGAILEVLLSTPRVTETRFFWSGNGDRKTAVGDWQAKMKRAFDEAKIVKGVSNTMSHRLRDTFSVELLQRGVSIETVSILLGHSSIRITERHYNSWVKARQEKLEADVERAWKDDPFLDSKNIRTISVHFAKGPVN